MPQERELFRRSAIDAQNVMNGRVRVSPPLGWKRINLFLVGIVAIAVILASMMTYSRTVSVNGTIQAENGESVIRARNSGDIKVSVELNSQVKEGQKIAEIVINATDEEGNNSTRQREAIAAEIAIAQQRADSARAAGESLAQAALLRSRSAAEQAKSLEDQLVQARIRTAAARTDLERARSIAERGFLSRRDLESRESEVATRMQEESRIQGEIIAAKGEELAGKAEARQARDQAQIASTEALETVSRARFSAASAAISQANVYQASQNGVVASLPFRSGQNVRAGDTIAVIMPDKGGLISILEISASQMAMIDERQTVKIAVDAFPYLKFGTIEGVIKRVNRAAIERNGESVFLVEVEVPETIRAYGKRERLLPGMSVKARIVTQKRTLIEWLLDPLLAVAGR